MINTINKIYSSSENYNVLVIVRGGGDQIKLDLFNDSSICELVARFNGYKVTGIGHKRDKFLLDLVIDFAANTPSAAGSHIKDCIFQQKSFKSEILLKSNNDLEYKLSELKSEKINLSNALENRISNYQIEKSIIRKQLKQAYLIIFIIIVIFIVVGYFTYNKFKQVSSVNTKPEIKQTNIIKHTNISMPVNKRKRKHK